MACSGRRSGCSMRAMQSAPRARSSSGSGPRTSSAKARATSMAGSAARSVVDAGGGQGLVLELLRQLEGPPRRGGGHLLQLGRGGQRAEERPAQLVVMALVRLDDVAIQRGGVAIAGRLAELDELPVLHDGDGLTRELSGGHALHRALQGIEVPEERPVALGQRIEGRRGETEGVQAFGDQPVVAGLVTHLTGESQLDRQFLGGDQPARGDLGRLDLVAERDLEEIDHGEVALDLRLRRGFGRQALEELFVLSGQPCDELVRGHARPFWSSAPSSWVSVSLVTTRRHRGCHRCVARASACVVKPSTGTPAPSRRARLRSWSRSPVSSNRENRDGEAPMRPISSAVRAKAMGTPARRAVARMRATKKRSLTTASTVAAGAALSAAALILLLLQAEPVALPLGDERQGGQILHAIDVHDPLEVIGLVLDDAGEEILGHQVHALAVAVVTLRSEERRVG